MKIQIHIAALIAVCAASSGANADHKHGPRNECWRDSKYPGNGWAYYYCGAQAAKCDGKKSKGHEPTLASNPTTKKPIGAVAAQKAKKENTSGLTAGLLTQKQKEWQFPAAAVIKKFTQMYAGKHIRRNVQSPTPATRA